MKTNKYFDTETMTVGYIADTAGEVWFHSDDGTLSREVGEGDTLIPYTEYAAFVAQMRSVLRQRRDNILTENGQCGNSIVTASGQHSDNNPTTRDTSAARDARRPPLTAKQICKANAAAVEVLKDAKIIKELSRSIYANFKALPTNTPQYIVDEINRRGIRRPDGKPYTQDTVSPIVSAMKTTARPSLFRVCYLIVLAVIVSVLITKAWGCFTASETGTETTLQTAEQNKINVDFDFVKQICKEQNLILTDFRVDLIVKKSYTDKAAVVAEVKKQYAEMQKVIKEK